MTIKKPARGLTLLALGCLGLAACTRWQPVQISPPDGGLAGDTDVRITRRDGSQQILREARSVADSIAGGATDELCLSSADGARTICADVRVQKTIPLSDVATLEIREFNPGGTVLFMIGAAVGLLLLVGVMAVASSDGYGG